MKTDPADLKIIRPDVTDDYQPDNLMKSNHYMLQTQNQKEDEENSFDFHT